MNNILEITYISNPNRECYIKKLDKDTYVNLKTGEVKECNHIESRADNSLQVSQSHEDISREVLFRKVCCR